MGRLTIASPLNAAFSTTLAESVGEVEILALPATPQTTGLDGAHPQPPLAGRPFHRRPRIRLSPHASAPSPQTCIHFAAKFADNPCRFRQGAPWDDVVDLDRGR